MMKITVKDGPKSYKTSREVVSDVRQGNSIARGDIGAYVVGVFACRSLSTDTEHYDPTEKGQWSHCLYKSEWTAALQGRDQFTGDQKELILAGVRLLRDYPHGWGRKALDQPHVRRMLEKWGMWQQRGSVDIHNEVKSFSDGLTEEVQSVHKAKARYHRQTGESTSSSAVEMDQIISMMQGETKPTLYEVGRAWLIEWTHNEFNKLSRKQAETIVELHLDPRNYVLDRVTDFESICSAIVRGEEYQQILKLLKFESVQTLLGVYRVHCRNLVNRQGVSDINRGGLNPTKAPKMLIFLDSLDENNWHGFYQPYRLLDHYLKVATDDNTGSFSKEDIRSLRGLRELGDRLSSVQSADAPSLGIMQGWLKVIKGMCGGVKYLRRFDMDVNKFLTHVSMACKTYQGTISLLGEYRETPEVGPALAANFFGDLGFKEFCKPDTHVCSIVNDLYGTEWKERRVFEAMLVLARQSQVAPRQLDKIFYLAGSGNFYLTNQSLSKSREDAYKRKNSLIRHLLRYQESV